MTRRQKYVLLPFEIPPPPIALDRRFAGVINRLFETVVACLFNGRLPGPVIFLITRRLARYRARFYALFARYADGKLPAPPLQTSRPRGEGTPSRPPPVDPLLRTFGWLRHLVPETVSGQGLLQHLVQTPEMADFLAAAPQAGRILRPLCRMLHLRPPPVLAPLKRPAQPPPKPTTRPPTPRPPLCRTFPPIAPPRRKRRAPRACGPPPFPA